MNKKIVITGGSTAGHLTPYLPIINELENNGWEIHLFGLSNEIEKNIFENHSIIFHKISAGKLRRYSDIKNFFDFFKVLKGLFDSYKLLRKIKPSIIFSKGGYLSVPVAVSAFFTKTPFLIHESDSIPSLSTKICNFFSKAVFSGFPIDKEWKTFFGIKIKKIYSGIPLRDEFKKDKSQKRQKNILIMGGSLGSVRLNDIIRASSKEILNFYNIYHICGAGKTHQKYKNIKGYHQYEFIHNISNYINSSDIVITRGGATSIYEVLYLGKPQIIIPLPKGISRGDQEENARLVCENNLGEVIFENDLSTEKLIETIVKIRSNYENYIKNIQKINFPDSTTIIMDYIFKYSK